MNRFDLLTISDGRIQTEDKKAKYPFLNGANRLTEEQSKRVPEFAYVIGKDFVLIDIDDSKQSDILFGIVQNKGIKCPVSKTTRGKHFYFANNGEFNTCKTNVLTAIGIRVDIKTGSKNCYAVEKVKGVERERLDNLAEGDSVDVVPYWLAPVEKPIEGTPTDFVGFGEGDGRNDGLFRQYANLENLGFSEEQIKETCSIINNYVFDNPLPQRELDTICRPRPERLITKGFNHVKIAKHIIANCNVIKIDGVLYHYEDGFYQRGDAVEKVVYDLCSSTSIKTYQVKEVLNYLKLYAPEKKQSDKRFLLFKNGVLDIDTKTLNPCSPDFVITNRIAWNYNEKAESAFLDTFLNSVSCYDTETRLLLEETIGEAMYRSAEHQKAFVLTGKGANGKSTFFALIRYILGKGNYSTSSLAQLCYRFGTSDLIDKLANLSDETPDSTKFDTETFKQITGNTGISAELKGVTDKIQFVPYATIFLSANEMPPMKFDEAIKRRLMFVRFDANFEQSKDRIFDLADRLNSVETVERAIRLGVDGLCRVIKNHGYFTHSKKSDKALTEYINENDSIFGFISDNDIDSILNHTVNSVFEKYRIYCQLNNAESKPVRVFSRELKQKLHIDTKSVRFGNDVSKVFVCTKETVTNNGVSKEKSGINNDQSVLNNSG